MRSSYRPEDVTLLLKDISGMLTPMNAAAREQAIQSGTHYSELLPLEYHPGPAYQDAYDLALHTCAADTAAAVCRVSELVYRRKGADVVLISLARAGIPIGILMKRYLERKYGLHLCHYAISIIRGKGIDQNAMAHILARHRPEQLQFVDGWTGKGAILRQLEAAIAAYPGVSPAVAVLADPANLTELCGTHEDILIPSSCLNCTVSGLISRTVLTPSLIGPEDFHGAVYHGELAGQDVSYDFIRAVEAHFSFAGPSTPPPKRALSGLEEVHRLAAAFQVSDLNLIKPGIGETTRVLLRRVPWKILIREENRNDPLLLHLYRLAEEKRVPVAYHSLENYRCCGIVRQLADS